MSEKNNFEWKKKYERLAVEHEELKLRMKSGEIFVAHHT